MNKTGFVKALMLLLSVAASFAPVIYALNKYEWNIQAMVMPSYSPPKVDFRLEHSGVKFEGGQLYVAFKLVNLGEVDVTFENVNAAAYAPDEEALAPVILDKPVTSHSNSAEALILKISINEASLNKLLQYFEKQDRINVGIRGEASISVFGTKARVPVSAVFEISLTDIVRTMS